MSTVTLGATSILVSHILLCGVSDRRGILTQVMLECFFGKMPSSNLGMLKQDRAAEVLKTKPDTLVCLNLCNNERA